MSAQSLDTERNSERGFALILALWLMLVVSALALSISLVSRTSVRIVANQSSAAQAQALADAGLYYAVAALAAGRGPERFGFDGRPVAFAYGGGTIALTAMDERGKLNLRRIPPNIARKAFESAGMPRERAANAVSHFSDVAHFYETSPSTAPPDRVGVKPIILGELRNFAGGNANLYHRLTQRFTLEANHTGVILAYATTDLLAFLSSLSEAERQQLGIRAPTAESFVPLVPNTIGIHAHVRLPSAVEAERYAVVRLTGSRKSPADILYWE